MATTTPTTTGDNPISTPPANQSLTAPGGGYVSTDPNIQAQIKAMQSQVVAQSQQAPGTLATGAQTGSTPSGQGIQSVPTTYQAYTTTPQMSGATKQQEIDTLASARPPGTAYNPATGTYQDPLNVARMTNAGTGATTTGSHFIGWGTGKYDAQGKEIISTQPLQGQPLNVGLRFSTDIARAIKPTIMSAEERSSLSNVGKATGGVLTTDGYNQTKTDIGNVIVKFDSPGYQTPHDLNGNLSYDQSVKDTLAAVSDSDPYKAVLLSIEDMRKDMARWISDPTTDPMYQLIAKQNQLMEERYATEKEDIEKSAADSYAERIETNKRIEGMTKMFIAGTGFSTSSSNQALALMSDTLNANEKALRQINEAKVMALRKASDAFADNNLQLAAKQIELAEIRHKEYLNLLNQSATIQTNMEEMAMKRASFAEDLKAKKFENAKSLTDFLSKNKIDPELVSDEQYGQIALAYSTSLEGAKSLYSRMLESEEATDYNEKLKKAMEAAKVVTDPNTEIALPNPDGGTTFVKRSQIQVPGDYESFDVSQGGLKYRAYIDKTKIGQDDALVAMIPIGEDASDVIHITGSDGSTWALDKSKKQGDPGYMTQLLDFAGNPVAGTAGVTTLNQYVPGGNYPTDSSVVSQYVPGTGVASMDLRDIFPDMPPTHPEGVKRQPGESISEYSNNPGAITYSYSGSKKETGIIQRLRDAGIEVSGVDSFGKPVVDSAGNKLAVFKTVEDGYRARTILMSSPTYSGLDLAHAMGTWSGGKDAEGRNMNYANYVSSRTGIPVSGVTMGSLNEYQKLALAQAQHEWESGKRGKGMISFSNVPFGENAGSRSPEPGNLMAKNVTWDDVKAMQAKSVGVDDGSMSKIVGKDLYIGNTVKSGKVEKVTDIGIEDGQTLKSIQVRDMDNGLLYTFHGVKDSTLSVGSKWSSSQATPAVGTASKDGYSATVANADGSAMKPTPLPATLEEAKAKFRWGMPGVGVTTNSKATAEIKAKVAELKAGASFYSVIDDIKINGFLSKFDSSTYMGSLYDAAKIGETTREAKTLDIEKKKASIATSNMMNLRRAAATWAQMNSVDNVSTNVMKFALSADMTVARMEEEYAHVMDKVRKGDPTQITDDAALLDSFVEVAKGGGTTVPMHLVDNITGNRSWRAQFEIWQKKINESRLLTDAERQSMISLGRSVANGYLKKGQGLIESQKKALKSNPTTAALADYVTDDIVVANTIEYNEAKSGKVMPVASLEEALALPVGAKLTYRGSTYQKTATGLIPIK